MPRVLVASNRGPLSFHLDGEGRPVPAGSGGGLAGTLRPLLAGTGVTWVATAMSEADRLAAGRGLMSEDGLEIVTLSPDPGQYRQAYEVISNGTLWFCHHHLFDLPRRPRFDRHWHEAWAAFRSLNAAFAEALAAHAGEGDVVLVQDYHLVLTGRLLAEARPDLATVHFSHTPFADPEILGCLPDGPRAELLAGMAGFGACGFHTARWEAAFCASFDPGPRGHAVGPGRPRTFVSPLGPNPRALAEEASSPDVARARAELETMVGDRQLIVRVDRMELSKNVLRGFWAFEELLADRPEWRGRVVFLALVYPSRETMAEYLAYRTEVEHTVARINDAWGTPEWTPIVLDTDDDRSRSMAALGRFDVLLVNPIRDGLNLVAKEGPLVNTVDGVVVLSRDAGAWEELGPAVCTVNPYDVTGTAAAMTRALAMGRAERAAQAAELRALVLRRTAGDWLADQLDQAARLGGAGGLDRRARA